MLSEHVHSGKYVGWSLALRPPVKLGMNNEYKISGKFRNRDQHTGGARHGSEFVRRHPCSEGLRSLSPAKFMSCKSVAVSDNL